MPARIAVAVVLAAASIACGQPATGLFKWEVSSDGGASWRSSIEINPGDSYKMRAWASYTDGSIPAIGFAAVEFEQIDFIGADVTDVFGGVSGAGQPEFVRRMQLIPSRPDGGQQIWLLQQGTGASAGGMKLDMTSGTTALFLSQFPKYIPVMPPYTGFDASNPIMVFEMDAVAGDPKLLTVSATWRRRAHPPGGEVSNLFGVYTTITGTWKKPAVEAVMADATVHIVPGPGGVAAIAAGLVSMRRRRST